MNWIRCRIEAMMKDHLRAGFKRWDEEERLSRAYACGVDDERLRISKEHPELDLYAEGQGN